MKSAAWAVLLLIAAASVVAHQGHDRVVELAEEATHELDGQEGVGALGESSSPPRSRLQRLISAADDANENLLNALGSSTRQPDQPSPPTGGRRGSMPMPIRPGVMPGRPDMSGGSS